MKKLFFDIETLPADESSYKILNYLYDKKSSKKKSKKVTDEEAEETGEGKGFNQFVNDTSFDGAFGRVLCIGYAINDLPTECIYNVDDEKATLKKFWEIASSVDLFIGHNIMDFDLRFLYQRSIILNVKPSKLDLSFARYRSSPIFDTMKEWSKWAMDKVPKNIEHIAMAMGVPSPKDGIDGSQVNDFHKAGRDKEICEYCRRDVETVRAIYKRMTFEDYPKESVPF